MYHRVSCDLRVVIVYLAGVVFGSVGGSLPSPTSYLAGASAGVYALIAAHVSTLIMNWKVGFVNLDLTKYWHRLRRTEPCTEEETVNPKLSRGLWIP